MGLSGRPKKVDSRINDIRSRIKDRDFETSKQIVNDFGINVQDGDGRTALINSVIENQIDFIKWLLENGADLNVQDRAGYSALHFVGQERLTEIGKVLLDKGADLELRDNYGNTPLWTAIMNSRPGLSVVKLFLDRRAKKDNINHAGRTPGQMIETIYGDTF